MGKIGQKFGQCRGVGIGDTPGGESSPKLSGHDLGVPKKLDTPAWCSGWLLLKTERKIPLNVCSPILAGKGCEPDSPPSLNTSPMLSPKGGISETSSREFSGKGVCEKFRIPLLGGEKREKADLITVQ